MKLSLPSTQVNRHGHLRGIYALLLWFSVFILGAGCSSAGDTTPGADSGTPTPGMDSGDHPPTTMDSGTTGMDAGDNGDSATTPHSYTIGGMVTGLLGTGLVLQNSLGDDLQVTKNGTFVFATAVANAASYSVTIKTQPTAPSQACTLTMPSGTVADANVTNVTVICSTSTFTVGGTVTGLTGTGLVLQNNAGDNVTVTMAGAFTFPTQIASGAAYAVTVQTQPNTPMQTCTVSNGMGMVGSAAVTNVAVACSTSTFMVGGKISGLANGKTVVLQNNGLVKSTLFWRSAVTPSPDAARSYWPVVSPASDDVTEVDLYRTVSPRRFATSLVTSMMKPMGLPDLSA